MAKQIPKSKYLEKIDSKKEVIDWKLTSENLRKQNNEIQKRYEILEIYTKKIEGKIKELEDQKKRFLDEQNNKNEKVRKELMKEKEIRVRDVLIKQMQMELRKTKELTRIHDNQYRKEQEFCAIKTSEKIPVIIINGMSKDEIMFAHRDYGLKDQVVWFRFLKDSESAINTLIDLNPKIVLNEFDEKSNELLKKQGIIVVNVKPEIHEFYGSIILDQLESSIKDKERKNFLQWLENYRRRDLGI